MTTYTLTVEQRGQLMTDLAKAYISSEALSMLQSLQPNTQEPVGWLIDGLDVVMSYARAKAEQAEHHAMGGTAVAYPIYTHPAPQQKPLTDEQIDAIDQSMCGEREFIVPFARAIEAAHNIKG